MCDKSNDALTFMMEHAIKLTEEQLAVINAALRGTVFSLQEMLAKVSLSWSKNLLINFCQ